MRVVHLSTSDSSGGAARAAYRLHTGLRRLGHESTLLVAERKTGDPTVRLIRYPMDLPGRLRRKLRQRRINKDAARFPNRPPGHEWFSDDRTEHGPQPALQLPPCDVVTLHWVARFVDYQGFFSSVPKNLPVVWRLADMNALTGGCHYDAGCGKFVDRCGACPQLGSTDPEDLSRQIWQRKKQSLGLLRPGQLHVVGTSRWIAAEAKRSSLLRDFPVSVIPNGLDVAEFAPRDKRFARDLLGVPQDTRVVLFAADDAENVRKGFRFVAEALRGITGVPNLFLLSVGVGRPEVGGSFRHLHLGKITNDRLLSAVYSAADVYVIASLQESFGQTVIESLACGTPVAGFASGGIPDMVRPGVTGELAPTGDVAALRDAVRKVLLSDPAAAADLSANCRRIAVAEYSLEAQANAYAALYQTLVEASRVAAASGLPMQVVDRTRVTGVTA